MISHDHPSPVEQDKACCYIGFSRSNAARRAFSGLTLHPDRLAGQSVPAEYLTSHGDARALLADLAGHSASLRQVPLP